MNKKQQKIIVVLGPTASGKSDLAVEIAKKFNGEVISADSRQIYRGMDIGTGKITKKEMQGIPHYLLNVVSPRRRFTVAQYRQKALKAIDKISKKNRVPIICGGTGFYIQTLVDGLVIPEVEPDLKLRKRLEKETIENLFNKLKKLDPQRAKNIDSKNKRRLIRALEIVLKTGRPVPKLKTQPQFKVLFLGIKKSQEKLEKLIKKRLLKRLKQGMVEEIKKLKRCGLSWKKLDDFGLEYRYVSKCLQGKLSKEEMIERLQKEIEHYAKRQMTWFKRDKRIRWINSYKETENLIKEFL